MSEVEMDTDGAPQRDIAVPLRRETVDKARRTEGSEGRIEELVERGPSGSPFSVHDRLEHKT